MSMTVEMILRLIDQATGPIRGVESELERLQKTAAAVDKQRASGGGVKASVWLEQQEALRKAREEAERYEQTMRKINAAQSAAMSAAAARGLERMSTATFRAGLREGVAGEHSQVSLEAQGNSLAEIEEIQRKAGELSRVYRAFSKTQIETMLGDAQTYVGSIEHAMAAMPEMLQLRAIQQGMHGHSSDKDFGYLAKALEQGGVANDPTKLHARMDTFARWMEVYRETFSVDAINEFYRGLKGPISRSLSENFLRGTAGHFIQELGGHQTGNALTQLYMAVVAGRAQPRALAAFDELGLLDEKKIHRGGPFGIKAADPGAVKGWKLFTTDPDRWITEILGPALARFQGDKREELEGALFSDQTARNIADKILNQWPTILKDRGFIDRAPGLAAWQTWAGKDPSMAVTGVRSQFDNLMRDAAKPFMPTAVRVMNWFSELESHLGKVAENHPSATAALGLGSVFAGWSAAAALARRGLIFAGQAWGEGLAHATGDVVKEPSFLKRFLFGGGKAGGFGSSVGHGLLSGLLYEAGKWALDTVQEKAFGWTPELLARNESEIERRAHSWWRSMGVDLPWWERPAPPAFFTQPQPAPTALQPIGPRMPIPTFAALEGVPGAGSSPAGAQGPHVDMSEVEDAVRKAEEAGQQIKQSLEVKAETHVDASSVDALLAKLREAVGLIGQINRGGANLRRNSYGHGLNDGAEAH